MKNLKPRTRTTPAEVLAIAAETAPTQPPAQMPVKPPPATQTLNLRFRETTMRALMAATATKGLTIKQLVANGLKGQGIAVDPDDLKNLTPGRRWSKS